MRYKPSSTGRRVTKEARRRASLIDDRTLGQYAETVVIQLGQAIDQWRYHSGPASEVAMNIDALMAIWNEVEIRGLE